MLFILAATFEALALVHVGDAMIPGDVQAVHPWRVGIEGSTEVLVAGRNFAVGSSTARCRLEISPLTGCDFPIQSDGREDRKNGSDPGHFNHSWDVSSLQRLRIPSTSNYTVPATVINSTHLVCTPPAVATDGVASLSVSMDGSVWNDLKYRADSSAKMYGGCILMYRTLTAAPSRRPFSGEADGAVVVLTDPISLQGAAGLRVSAHLATPAVTLLDHVPIQGGTFLELPFSMGSLPRRILTRMTVTLHVGSRQYNVSRRFERIPPAQSPAVASSVDYSTGAILVNGTRWIVTGMYTGTAQIVGQPSPWINSGNVDLERLAKGGLNTAMIYGLGEQTQTRQQTLDNMHRIGVKVMVHIVSLVVPLLLPQNPDYPTAGNTTANWQAFASAIKDMKDHPAVLGWYICDDCSGIAAREPAGKNMTEWEQAVALGRVYDALHYLDQYHITIGAQSYTSSKDLYLNQDTTGVQSIDLGMVENYDSSLKQIVEGGNGDFMMTQLGANLGPIVNCPYVGNTDISFGEAGWEKYTPRQLRTSTLLSSVTSGVHHQLFFVTQGARWENQPEFTQAADGTSLQIQELMPALLAPRSRPQLSASVTIESMLGPRESQCGACPPGHLPYPACRAQLPLWRCCPPCDEGVVANVFSEHIERGDADGFCIHVVAVNYGNTPLLANVAIHGVAAFNLPVELNATLPFQPLPARNIPVTTLTQNSRGLRDFIESGDTKVYRIGCTTEKAKSTNLVKDFSFEDFSVAGRPMWWFLPVYGMIPPLDPRADMMLDTRAPQHGRHSLRVTVPSLQPLVFPFSPAQDTATERGVGAYELLGMNLKAYTHYDVSIWARSEPSGMQLEFFSGEWVNVCQESCGFKKSCVTRQSYRNVTVSSEWQQISLHLRTGSVAAGFPNGYPGGGHRTVEGQPDVAASLHVRAFGQIGMLHLDHAEVYANASRTR